MSTSPILKPAAAAAIVLKPRFKVSAKIPKTPIDIPPEAFYVPTEEEYYLNKAYWNGWLQCAGFIVNDVIVMPSPKGTGDYANYEKLAIPYYLPDEAGGWVINGSAGWNNAVDNAMNYVWRNDPESPHKVPA